MSDAARSEALNLAWLIKLRWVVVLGRPVLGRDGAITVTAMGSKRGFRSRKLGRVFAKLIFAYQSD